MTRDNKEMEGGSKYLMNKPGINDVIFGGVTL